VGNAEPFQFFYTGSRILPLFPDDGPQAASYPSVYGSETGGHLGMSEVIPPAFDLGIKPSDDLLNTQPTVNTPALAHS
jgi:hypothetical protein